MNIIDTYAYTCNLIIAHRVRRNAIDIAIHNKTKELFIFVVVWCVVYRNDFWRLIQISHSLQSYNAIVHEWNASFASSFVHFVGSIKARSNAQIYRNRTHFMEFMINKRHWNQRKSHEYQFLVPLHFTIFQ